MEEDKPKNLKRDYIDEEMKEAKPSRRTQKLVFPSF